MSVRHFLTLNDVSPDEFRSLIARAIAMKTAHREGREQPIFQNKTLAMLFDKSSTRTRVSFEAGMAQLGGHAIFLSSNDSQLGRGEPVEDSARVISSMVDIIMVRTFAHESLQRFAEYSTVPVINALTDDCHPCQLLADMQTFFEKRGDIRGRKVAWIGDGNNMCHSYINAAALLDFQLTIACPEGYEPAASMLEKHSGRIQVSRSPQAAVQGAELVVTDTWASMGQEEEKAQRIKDFRDYQVDEKLMAHAAEGALFMHCLPAYRGMEISETIMDSKYSAVWDEAENRLHAQKALMAFLLGK